VAADIAMFSREFSFAFDSIVLCSCAQLFLIATWQFDRAGFVDRDEVGFFAEDKDKAESSFGDRDEADFLDFLDDKEVNEGLFVESNSATE
jgi:hypothetical protein